MSEPVNEGILIADDVGDGIGHAEGATDCQNNRVDFSVKKQN